MKIFSIFSFLIVVGLSGLVTTSVHGQADEQRLIQITRWYFEDIAPASVSVESPPDGPAIVVRIRASGFPTSAGKLANRVIFNFVRIEGGADKKKLPEPTFHSTGPENNKLHTIEMWFDHWQLPAVLAMLGKVDRNEAVYCQFKKASNTPYAQCHSNPLP